MDNKSGLDDNIAGLLSYFVVPGVLFLVIEPYKNKPFVRFHAFQGIFFWLLAVAVGWVLGIVATVLPFLVLMVSPLIMLYSLGMLCLGIFCMYKAFNNEMFELPVLGDLAKKQAG